MAPMGFALALLFATAGFAGLTVLSHSVRRAVLAWSELRHALATCPETRSVRITRVDLLVQAASPPARLRLVSRPAPRHRLPALRAAA